MHKVIMAVVSLCLLSYASQQTDLSKSERAKTAPGACVQISSNYEKPANPMAWTTLLFADFESGMPAGWTVVDGNGDGMSWTTGTTPDLSCPPPNMGTAYAYYSDDDAGSGAPASDEQLYSPAVYVGSGFSQLRISYGFSINSWDYDDQMRIYVRTFSGGSWGAWTQIATYIPDVCGQDTFDLTAYLPCDSIQFQAQYVDAGGWN